MAANDKEMQHECWYRGEHDLDLPKSEVADPASPSPEKARLITLGVLSGRVGRFHSTSHFRQRMEEREFDILDVEYVIRNGTCVEGGIFCIDYRNHKYTFRGNIDGTDFETAFALSADHDLILSPLVVLITGCFKTRSGRRRKTY